MVPKLDYRFYTKYWHLFGAAFIYLSLYHIAGAWSNFQHRRSIIRSYSRPRLLKIPTTLHCSGTLVDGPSSKSSSYVAPIVNKARSDISVENPYGDVITSKAAARKEILEILRTKVDSLDIHFRLEYLVKVLERTHTPIQTIPFLNHAIAGKWNKVYTNVISPRAVSSLKCDVQQIVQYNSSKLDEGWLTEQLSWCLVPTDNGKGSPGGSSSQCDTAIEGLFEVRCSYSVNSRGQLSVCVEEHCLRPNGRLPDNVEAFVLDLQRTVPFESFDPDGTIIDITVRAYVVHFHRYLK